MVKQENLIQMLLYVLSLYGCIGQHFHLDLPAFLRNQALWLTEVSAFTCSLLHRQLVWLKHVALPLHLSSNMLRDPEQGSCDWRLWWSFLSPLLSCKSLMEPLLYLYVGQTSGLTRPPAWGWPKHSTTFASHNCKVDCFTCFFRLCGKFKDRRKIWLSWKP